jgi:hypothetical protein
LDHEPVAGPVAEVVWRELRPILDEEIHRLPGKYRRPVVLHYLEGKTRRETARQLGWPEGTVAVRLARARDWMRRRLERRGLALSAGALAAALAQTGAAEAMPLTLAAATVKLAAGGITSAEIVALTEGVLRAMFVTKLKIAAGIIGVSLGIAVTGAGTASVLGVREAPAASAADDKPHAQAKPADAPATAPVAQALLLLKYPGPVYCCAFSPDGKLLAAGGSDKIVHLWEARSGKEIHQLLGARTAIKSVSFTPDNRTLAAGSDDPAVRVWDVGTGKQTVTLMHPATTRAAAFSPDGATLVTGSTNQEFSAWDGRTGRMLAKAVFPSGEIIAVACSPDGKMVATAGRAGTILLLDSVTARIFRQFQRNGQPVGAVAFSPDNRALATASEDGIVGLWDLATGKEQHRCTGHKGAVHAIAFTPGGKQLISAGADGTLIVWGTDSGKPLRRAVRHRGPVRTVAVSPDGRWIASGGNDGVLFVSALADLRDFQAKPVKLSAKQLDELWGELANADTGRGYQAVWTLIGGGKDAVAYLNNKVKPAEAARVPPDLARWIKELDDDSFAVREKASQQLAQAGPAADKAIRQALAAKPSLEARSRLNKLLKQRETGPVLSPDELRAVRAVDVLAQIGTPEARAILARLAKGAPESEITRQAAAAVDRQALRSVPNR